MTKFEDTTRYREIVLRGTYLSMAADVEWIMMMILSNVFKGHEIDIDDFNGDKTLDRFTLSEKIGAVEIGLIRYYTEFYIDHQDDFKQLHLLRKMRNRFGHGKIDLVDGDKENVWISELTKTGIEKNQYQMSVLITEIEKYHVSIKKFLNLVMSVIGNQTKSA